MMPRDLLTDGRLLYGVVLAMSTILVPMAAYAQSKSTVTVINPVSNPVNTRITNSSVLTVDADNPDRKPIRADLCQAGTSAGACESNATIFTAPPDQDVVFNIVSGECSIVNESYFRALNAYIDFGSGSFEQTHFFYPNYATPPGFSHTIHLFHIQTHLQVPAGGRLRLAAFAPLTTGSGLAFCNYYLSGYAVNA